jgi:hypothetical protein
LIESSNYVRPGGPPEIVLVFSAAYSYTNSTSFHVETTDWLTITQLQLHVARLSCGAVTELLYDEVERHLPNNCANDYGALFTALIIIVAIS